MAPLAGAVAAADAASLADAVALIRPFLTDIGWFERMMAAECAALAADPRHVPAYRASRSGGARHLVLARTERIWVSATCIDAAGQDGDAGSGRVHFSGRYLLCRPLGRTLHGEGYRLERGRLVPAGPVICPAGAMLERDERRETVRIRPGRAPLLLLRAQVAPPGPVTSCLYDMGSGAPVGRAETDEAHARALMLLSLLRLQGRADAAGHFEAALDGPLGAQRWAVMREYLALDTARALPRLEAMARGDPDEAVRDLAARTLAQARGMGGGAPCPA